MAQQVLHTSHACASLCSRLPVPFKPTSNGSQRGKKSRRHLVPQVHAIFSTALARPSSLTSIYVATVCSYFATSQYGCATVCVMIQAILAEGQIVLPEEKKLVLPKYCESTCQTIRRRTRTINVSPSPLAALEAAAEGSSTGTLSPLPCMRRSAMWRPAAHIPSGCRR